MGRRMLKQKLTNYFNKPINYGTSFLNPLIMQRLEEIKPQNNT